ncbi:hypothetical protein WBJ53_26040 [Spirosoma sp. SC4-14]|uniref:hypothetical protein n=1 Tax=Spirosoma sp. SC4-14 TaxID=3128900 RepID=UPI0030CCA102
MIVKNQHLDKAQVARMKAVYGMSHSQILAAAQAIVDPTELNRQRPNPSKRGRRFVR